MGAIRTHYLDASALVKLLVNEQGSEVVRKYFDQYSNFYTPSLCFAETLTTLKFKYRKKEITQREYIKACNLLMAHISAESIGIDEIEIANRQTYWEVEKLAQKYNLDISDAFQIFTLKKGYFSILGGESEPILITADFRLADAARQEELRVWNCMKEPEP